MFCWRSINVHSLLIFVLITIFGSNNVTGCRRGPPRNFYDPVYMRDFCRNGQGQRNVTVEFVGRLRPGWPKYQSNMNCTFFFNRARGSSLNMYVNFLDIDIPGTQPGTQPSCQFAHVQVYSVNQKGNLTPLSGRLCGRHQNVKFNNHSNIAVQFVSGTHSTTGRGFDLIVNPFHTDSSCMGYRCNNRRCIRSELHCDLYDNCGDNSDENNFYCDRGCGRSCAIGLGVFFAFTAVVTTVLCCICKEPSRRPKNIFRRVPAVPNQPVHQGEAPPTYTEAMGHPIGSVPNQTFNPTYAGPK